MFPRHRRRRPPVSPAQLSLPLDCWPSGLDGRLQNPSRSKVPSETAPQARLASSSATRAQRGIVQASSEKANIGYFIRQRQLFWLTCPHMSSIFANVNQNGWRCVSTLPPLSRSPEPVSGEGCAHVGRGSQRRLPAYPVVRNQWRAGLPALRLRRRVRLQDAPPLEMQSL